MGRVETQAKLHNELAGDIVKAIVKPVIESGGGPTAVMVLLETVVVGCCLAVIKLGGDEAVLDVVIDGARKRLAELRLKDIETKGQG